MRAIPYFNQFCVAHSRTAATLIDGLMLRALVSECECIAPLDKRTKKSARNAHNQQLGCRLLHRQPLSQIYAKSLQQLLCRSVSSMRAFVFCALRSVRSISLKCFYCRYAFSAVPRRCPERAASCTDFDCIVVRND